MTYKDKLKLPEWKNKANDILNRDEFTCKNCGCEPPKVPFLDVHHLKYIGENPWDTPSKFLVTLCRSCHDNWHYLHDYGKSSGNKVHKSNHDLEDSDFIEHMKAHIDLLVTNLIRNIPHRHLGDENLTIDDFQCYEWIDGFSLFFEKIIECILIYCSSNQNKAHPMTFRLLIEEMLNNQIKGEYMKEMKDFFTEPQKNR